MIHTFPIKMNMLQNYILLVIQERLKHSKHYFAFLSSFWNSLIFSVAQVMIISPGL